MDNTNSSTMRLSPRGVALAREWPSVMLIAVLTLALGVVVLVWPSQTLVVVSVVLGIQLLLFGLFRLVGAFATDTEQPVLSALVGILVMIAGVIVVRNPFETVAVLAVILGVAWIVGGAIDVVASISGLGEGSRLWTALGGLLTLAAGIIVVAWPAPTVTVIAWISGLYLVIFGLYLAASAWTLRSMTR
jgi:uncharacterized membrane protein HdeD (DUF308 family)